MGENEGGGPKLEELAIDKEIFGFPPLGSSILTVESRIIVLLEIIECVGVPLVLMVWSLEQGRELQNRM